MTNTPYFVRNFSCSCWPETPLCIRKLKDMGFTTDITQSVKINQSAQSKYSIVV